MELFRKLFGSLLVLVYHCFDRVVINGYLSGLSRPANIVYLFRNVRGEPAVTQELLAQRTRDYQKWVEGFAAKRAIRIMWAEKGVRKEDYVQPWLRRRIRSNRFGVYFIFKSMEQGMTFRSIKPRYPTDDPNYRIIARTRSRFTHYYFYILDPTLGPMVMRVGSFLPFQTTYYINGHSYIEGQLNSRRIKFKKHDNAILSTSSPRALQAAANRLTPNVIRARIQAWTLELAPKFSRHERDRMYLKRFYAISQIEYCCNYVFARHFPIHKLFERSCDLGLWLMTTDKISQIFGVRLTRKLQGKLQSTLEKMDQGHHVFRAYFKSSFVKQYEKFRVFLRNEVCSNNLRDFGMKKGLDHLLAVRERFLSILDRYASFQARSLNVHVDFPLFQRIAKPIQVGATRIPGIKLHDTRIVRLMEVLLHSGTQLAGWRSADLHQAVLAHFQLSPRQYRLSQLRYDLRKIKAHGLIERVGRRYAYRLSDKGAKVALLFVLFHKRVCGPIANSLFHHQPDPKHSPNTKLETALHRADQAIERVIEVLKAA